MFNSISHLYNIVEHLTCSPNKIINLFWNQIYGNCVVFPFSSNKCYFSTSFSPPMTSYKWHTVAFVLLNSDSCLAPYDAQLRLLFYILLFLFLLVSIVYWFYDDPNFLLLRFQVCHSILKTLIKKTLGSMRYLSSVIHSF